MAPRLDPTRSAWTMAWASKHLQLQGLRKRTRGFARRRCDALVRPSDLARRRPGRGRAAELQGFCRPDHGRFSVSYSPSCSRSQSMMASHACWGDWTFMPPERECCPRWTPHSVCKVGRVGNGSRHIQSMCFSAVPAWLVSFVGVFFLLRLGVGCA